MRSNELRKVVINMQNDGLSYGEISGILNISRQGVVNLCNYQLILHKKRGPKEKINGFTSYQVKREVLKIKISGEKVTAAKFINNCNLNICKSTY